MIIQIRIEANKDDMAEFIKELTRKEWSVPQFTYATTDVPLGATVTAATEERGEE